MKREKEKLIENLCKTNSKSNGNIYNKNFFQNNSKISRPLNIELYRTFDEMSSNPLHLP